MNHRTLALTFALFATSTAAEDSYRGLKIAQENRCSYYDAADYSYPQSVEDKIVKQLGGRVYGPYSGTCFNHTGQTDIEHIVARSEAHDSGLCAADIATRRAFARDLLNLTLASPGVNRHQKRAKDIAQWTPDRNACWYVNRTLEVRRKYGLTIDRAEAQAAERILSNCALTTMVVTCEEGVTGIPVNSKPVKVEQAKDSALNLWDDNGNGRITCAEARRHGIAPVSHGHPAYPYMRDGDGDGIVCE